MRVIDLIEMMRRSKGSVFFFKAEGFGQWFELALTGVGGGGAGTAQVEGGGVADGLAAEAGVAPVGGSVAESTGIAGPGARHLAVGSRGFDDFKVE